MCCAAVSLCAQTFYCELLVDSLTADDLPAAGAAPALVGRLRVLRTTRCEWIETACDEMPAPGTPAPPPVPDTYRAVRDLSAAETKEHVLQLLAYRPTDVREVATTNPLAKGLALRVELGATAQALVPPAHWDMPWPLPEFVDLPAAEAPQK
jgi:hypothetical protein